VLPFVSLALAIGLPACSIRDTAACLRSWNRHKSAAIFSSDSSPSSMPCRIFAALSLAASHASKKSTRAMTSGGSRPE
jgi:hypothetical protein